jgi:hypothetical protein
LASFVVADIGLQESVCALGASVGRGHRLPGAAVQPPDKKIVSSIYFTVYSYKINNCLKTAERTAFIIGSVKIEGRFSHDYDENNFQNRFHNRLHNRPHNRPKTATLTDPNQNRLVAVLVEFLDLVMDAVVACTVTSSTMEGYRITAMISQEKCPKL